MIWHFLGDTLLDVLQSDSKEQISVQCLRSGSFQHPDESFPDQVMGLIRCACLTQILFFLPIFKRTPGNCTVTKPELIFFM